MDQSIPLHAFYVDENVIFEPQERSYIDDVYARKVRVDDRGPV